MPHEPNPKACKSCRDTLEFWGISMDSKIYRCTSCRTIHMVSKNSLDNDAGKNDLSLLVTASFT